MISNNIFHQVLKLLKSTIKEDVSMLNMVTLNSLAPGKPGCLFKTAIFNLVLLIGIFTLSTNNALRWMAWDLTDDKSTLVQVMAWCHQATSHYLSQCWPSSMSPYGVTRPQWVKQLGICFSSCVPMLLTMNMISLCKIGPIAMNI